MVDEGRLLRHRGFPSSVKKTSWRTLLFRAWWLAGGLRGSVWSEYQGVLKMYGEKLKKPTPEPTVVRTNGGHRVQWSRAGPSPAFRSKPRCHISAGRCSRRTQNQNSKCEGPSNRSCDLIAVDSQRQNVNSTMKR